MKYKIITTDKGKVLVDKSAKGKEGYCFNKGLNRVDRLCRDYEKHSTEENTCFKIIVTINFSLDKDLPMVIVKDEVEKLAKEIVMKNNPNGAENFSMAVFNGLVSDITKSLKAQQKDVYSEEDLIKAIDMARLQGSETFLVKYTEDEIIQSLKQEYIELERKYDAAILFPETRLKTDRVDGQLMVYVKNKN